MFYVGENKFHGTGNAGNNTITGGGGDDILKGMGGNDHLIGGLGRDEVQLRGVEANYTITVEGAGYRVVDAVAGRDGSTFVESIEVLRFLPNNIVRLLTYPPTLSAPDVAEKAAPDTAAPQVQPLLDDGFLDLKGRGHGGEPLVQPGLPSDWSGDAGVVDTPFDQAASGFGFGSGDMLWSLQFDLRQALQDIEFRVHGRGGDFPDLWS
jgi:hypothetical protein